jgi:hypothetical protein
MGHEFGELMGIQEPRGLASRAGHGFTRLVSAMKAQIEH